MRSRPRRPPRPSASRRSRPRTTRTHRLVQAVRPSAGPPFHDRSAILVNLGFVRPLRRVVGAIWIALFASLVVFSLFTHVAPAMGHQLFTIVGGSMEPTIPLGSLVLVSPKDPMQTVVGDIVT